MYFWAYEPGPLGTRRVWRYVGPVVRLSTRTKTIDLLTAYHLAARREMDRRIQRLMASRA